jgi:hypothetical protein
VSLITLQSQKLAPLRAEIGVFLCDSDYTQKLYTVKQRNKELFHRAKTVDFQKPENSGSPAQFVACRINR